MSEFHADMGPQYEGEAIRKENVQVEFGGPKVPHKFELVALKGMDEVEHEKIEIIGPDIADIEEGERLPLAILIDVAGEELEKDMEPVFERRIHMYSNYIEGFWHTAQRDNIWIRLHKDTFKKGLNSLREIGEILIFLFTSELDIIEKISVTFITDGEKVKELRPNALEIYEARDARARDLGDEHIDEFYGCILCQAFAPTHICFITPDRIANCGAISWFDGRAAHKLDPEGPVFAVPKGELLSAARGEYAGVNAVAKEKSLGSVEEVYLYSSFGRPHTSCGCFQSICFYIPEVDAFGIVYRDFAGESVIGLPFSQMAGETSGGRQVEGSCGMGLEYLRSSKFFQADGGLRRVVWMPKEIKERYRDAIPDDVYDKIATEEDVKNTDELIEFLDRVEHPWLQGEVELPED